MSANDKPGAEAQSAKLTRRQLCGTLAGAWLSSWVQLVDQCPGPLDGHRVWGQASTSVLQPLNRLPRTLHDWFETQVEAAAKKSALELAAIETADQARAFVEQCRQRVQESFGPLPERTPLQPRVSGIIETDVYTVEKIAFESRPQFFVTGNMYIPKAATRPVPGVIGVCGHSTNGKAAEAYQSFAQGLARLGFAAFLIDPIGQGERLQYPDAELKSTVGAGVLEHLMCGNQQTLVAEFFGTWRCWDAMRALDYLSTRPEVDPRKIGITGNSGGGTETTWLCGMDPRWAFAAPSCFVTTMLRNFQNELPQDIEQCPPRAMALGLDHFHFLAAMAPRPVIILAQEFDYFDARGSAETYERLKKLYGLLGATGNVQLHIGPDPHGYSKSNREAMYGFFQRAAGLPVSSQEPSLTIEPDARLFVTPRGQVVDFPSRTVFDFTREKAAVLAEKRGMVDAATLVDAVTEILKFPLAPIAPNDRILRLIGGRRYPLPHATTYAIETEPDLLTTVYRLSAKPHVSRLPANGPKCVLYVSHHSADEELRSHPWVRELCASAHQQQTEFLACDLRGIGESRPNTCGADSFLSAYGSDFFYAAHGLMLDRPLLGQRTYDLIQILSWLVMNGYTQIHLTAWGWGTLPSVFAALMHTHLRDTKLHTTLHSPLTSYQELADAATYQWPLSCLLPNVLTRFDLPDCYRALADRGLTLIDPVGAEGVPRPA
jgi:cephalosporin-C deacetylase-like acetyl esterase